MSLFIVKLFRHGSSLKKGILKLVGLGHARVVDPHWFNADPDPAFFLIAKIEKNVQLEIFISFFDQKLQFTYP